MLAKADIELYMALALEQAQLAFAEDEIPIGCVLLHHHALVAREHNRTRALADPLAHCESLAIHKALALFPDTLVRDMVLITTLEPCLMCSGMVLLAKLKEVHFGIPEPKTGAVRSLYHLFDDPRLNHRPTYSWGYRERDIRCLMQRFFQSRRKRPDA